MKLSYFRVKYLMLRERQKFDDCGAHKTLRIWWEEMHGERRENGMDTRLKIVFLVTRLANRER
jgi:hypothetical protein